MPKKPRIPAVVHHRATDRDVVFLRDAGGRRRTVYLGPHGSPEAARRYRVVMRSRLKRHP
jgi:hypothetical protein